jgi:hypothetical protein
MHFHHGYFCSVIRQSARKKSIGFDETATVLASRVITVSAVRDDLSFTYSYLACGGFPEANRLL